jgi:hypothetical protein
MDARRIQEARDEIDGLRSSTCVPAEGIAEQLRDLVALVREARERER